MELLADTPGLEIPCEEDPALELSAGPLEVDDAGGTTMLESDEEALIVMLESDEGGLMITLEPVERLITMLMELVTALLVVST
jgi:hypothetical protein